MLKVAHPKAKRRSASSFVGCDAGEAGRSVVDFPFLPQLGAAGSGREEEERKRLEGERQLLLTVLLAQVCAQQDVTPRTFCEQILRLYERGILDSVSPPLLQRLDRASEATAICASFDPRRRSSLSGGIGVGSGISGGSGIRGDGGSGAMAVSSSASGALFMSRYERDYEELGLIARGAFGDVYRARHRLDGNEYAIKKVTFRGARGLDSPRAQLSLREVTNLSRLDHPNVVRYYTAWLDSTFLARIGASGGGEDGRVAAAVAAPRQLLAPLEETLALVAGVVDSSAEAAAAPAVQDDPPAWIEEVSEWSAPAGGTSRGAADDVSSVSGAVGGDGGDGSSHFPYYSGYDDGDDEAVAFVRQESDVRGSISSAMLPTAAAADLPGQGHTITLFISMGLCRGATLQEWLRVRNRRIAVRRATSADLGATVAAAAAAAAAGEGLDGGGTGERSTGSSPMPLTRQRSWSAGSDTSPSAFPGSASDREVDMTEALALFRQLMQGLAHVHAKKLLHRDCKPENIFLVEDDEGGRVVKLGDFGLSTANADGPGGAGSEASDEEVSREESELARRTIGVGTASYAAPENLSGPHYGPLSDIFSCGLILLELACPFQTAHERAAAFGAVRRSPPAVPAALQRRHPQVAALVLRLTASDAVLRPSAAEVLEWELLHSPTPEEAALRHQLAEKDVVIERLRRRLDELSAAAAREAGS